MEGATATAGSPSSCASPSSSWRLLTGSSRRNSNNTSSSCSSSPPSSLSASPPKSSLVIPEQIAVYFTPAGSSNSNNKEEHLHLLGGGFNNSSRNAEQRPTSYGSSSDSDPMPLSPMFIEGGERGGELSRTEALVCDPAIIPSIVLQSSDRPGTPTTLSSAEDMMMMNEPLSSSADHSVDANGAGDENVPSMTSTWFSSSFFGDCGSSRDSKLSLAGLAVMVFYSVSGGPFGVEASVRSAGNFYTLLGFCVFPFIWSVQEAMMTAELGAAFPEASGGVAWVEEAFGSKWGFMSGYLGWIAGATDNAIYPVLFLDYLLEVVNTYPEGEGMNSVVRFSLLAVTSVMLSYVNWMGLPVVGNMSIGICAVAMSPFVILVIVGAFSVDPSRWLEGPTTNATVIDAISDDDGSGIVAVPMMGGVLLRPFLNNLFWNLNSFDAGASFAEDIDDPGRVLPKAMGYSIVMVVLGYLLPLLVALGASDSSQADWVDGYLAKVCSDIVGPWLGTWTVFAAGISNVALFQAELSADAFQLMGMADRGHLPQIFATRSRHGTPTYGILLGCGIIVAMGAANVDRLIEMLNFNYSVSLLMEYAAFIKLRMARPDLPRPFRIPLNTFWCIVALVPTVFFTFLILVLADFATYAFAIAVNAAGYGLYHCMRQIRERQEQEQPIIPLVCTSYLCSRGGGSRTATTAGSRRTGGIIHGKKYERVDSSDVTTVQTEDDTETRFTASSDDNSGSMSSNTSVISNIIRTSNNQNNDTTKGNTNGSQEHR